MSRGRTGLIKAIKEVFREVKVFGDAEISSLRNQLESHKVLLEQMKATRQERQRREEALALLEMRHAVEHLQKLEGLIANQDERLEAAAEELARKARARQEREMLARATRVVQGMDMHEVVTADEGTLQQHLERMKAKLEAELEAAGRGLPSPSAAAATAAGSGDGGKAGRRKQ